jgi:hypothetical protein
MPHLKFFRASYGEPGCIFFEHTPDNGQPISNARPFAWTRLEFNGHSAAEPSLSSKVTQNAEMTGAWH